MLLREGRRVLRKYGERLAPDKLAKVREAVDALSKTLIGRDWEQLTPAINALDKVLDEHLAFARKSTVREYVESVGVAVLIALLLRAFVVEAFKIPSGSMIPTLQVGDHIFVNKFIYGIRIPFTDIKLGMHFREPKRGEVIVFIYPKEHDKDFIKRIVAVPGDELLLRDDQLFVNGKPVARKHVAGDCHYDDYEEADESWSTRACDEWTETLADGTTYHTYVNDDLIRANYGPITVPADSVFCMGDNRDNSNDSRGWGFVPYDLIRGKAMFIWFSVGKPGEIRFNRMFSLVH